MPTVLEEINRLTLAMEAIASSATYDEVKAVAYAVETAAQTANRRDLRHLFDVPVDSLPVHMPPVNTGRQAEATARRKKRRIDAAVLRVIANQPGITTKEIAAKLCITYEYASTNVTRLTLAGCVRAEGGRPVKFYPVGEEVRA